MFNKKQSFPPLPVEDLQQIFHDTSLLWEEARGKCFFITGGTGFFGMWLLESFAYINDAMNLGARALILTRSPDDFAKKAPHLCARSDLQFIQGDIRSFSFPSSTCDYIVHAATDVRSGTQANPDTLLSATISGTQRVLDFAAHAKVKKLLLTSSGAVYGNQPFNVTHTPEEYLGAPDPLLESSAYGEGKRVSEQLCSVHACHHGYEVKIARCFAFVGPHLPLDSVFAIGNFIRDALAQQPIRINGDGSPLRSYLYASDLASWLWTLLFRAPSNRAYNIGSDDQLSISELADLVNVAMGASSIVEIGSKTVPGQTISRYVPSILRAQKELGLQVTVPVSEAITKTASWIRITSIS